MSMHSVFLARHGAFSHATRSGGLPSWYGLSLCMGLSEAAQCFG